jgi:succinyl-diaminopimelate desuccinylase
MSRLRGIEAELGGIGGVTCAPFLRNMGVPVAVWSTTDKTAHQPNEYAKVSNIVSDARAKSF